MQDAVDEVLAHSKPLTIYQLDIVTAAFRRAARSAEASAV